MANLLTQSPLTSTERFGSMFDDLFDTTNFFNGFYPASIPTAWYPAVDVKENDKEYTFNVETPGLNKEDIEVELQGNMLTIKGKRMEEREEKGENYVRRERRSGSFQRSFRIEDGVKPDQVNADYQKGVLTVKVPKISKEQPKRIAVK